MRPVATPPPAGTRTRGPDVGPTADALFHIRERTRGKSDSSYEPQSPVLQKPVSLANRLTQLTDVDGARGAELESTGTFILPVYWIKKYETEL